MINWRLCAGFGLTLAGWIIPRAVAGARLRATKSVMLDIMPPLVFFILFSAITARPIFAGALTFALMGGFAFTDWVKRATLMEPVIFSDLGEAIELFRHPGLYLPFAGAGRVLAGAAGAFILFLALLILEPPAWSWSLGAAILIPGGIVAAGWVVHGPLLARAAAGLRKLGPTSDPIADARAIGPLAMQFTYSLIARDERAHRRGPPYQPAARPTHRQRRGAGGPVVVVQCESFFHPARLHPALPVDLLPTFNACRRSGVQSGRLTVPGWGANTTRSEFAVLTGLADEALGFDRFNPYFAFARARLASLAWRMRAQGCRTICIHPFDRTFYRRDQIMPNLGFDVFLGEEAFAGAKRVGSYIADAEVARLTIELMREEGPDIFVFAITMENHGPWDAAPRQPIVEDPWPNLPDTVERRALKRYVDGVRSGDAMLRMLTDEMSARDDIGICAFYGDHLPSLPGAFAACGFHDPRSDYVIWRSDGGAGLQRDLAAHDLGDAIWDAVHAPHFATAANI